MDNERLQELAALHAVGALDGQDAEEFRRLVADCSCLRREIEGFTAVAAGLAESAPAKPPPELKARILDQIGQTARSPWDEFEKVLPPRTEGFVFLQKAAAADWQALPVPGAFLKLLSIDQERGFAVALGKLEPGARYPSHRHFEAEDVFMLSGDLHIGERVLLPGDYHHAAAGTVHPVNFSENGCTLIIVLSTQDLEHQLGRTPL